MLPRIKDIRRDFPIFEVAVHGKPLAYLDNAATTQIPIQVTAAIDEQYRYYNGNIHRGIHYLSETSTARVECARATVRDFIGARETAEVIFTSGTTQSINIVAGSYRETLQPGDEILVSSMEHHSNLCPWQNACRRSGATLKTIPIDEKGDLRLEAYRALLSERTKLVAITYCSNVLGTVNAVRQLIQTAHEKGALVLVDAAQMMRHTEIDVQTLDCDFLCFSGHKIMGPTGIGVLYGKRQCLEQLQPVQYGGGMVDTVTLEGTTHGELPFRLEPGTPNIAGIIGLEAAVHYLTDLGISEIAAYEKLLLSCAEERLRRLAYVKILGEPDERAGVISFSLDGFHYYDVAKLLDQLGVAVRSGHLCAQPLLSQFGIEGVVRISPAFYNLRSEIDALTEGLEKIHSLIWRHES
jgi:cysteine desulfurase/selenocysteine lyase